jgi:signal transduction histidine kinase
MVLKQKLSKQFAARDILLKNKKRHYIRSSSFFMALLFTFLCGVVALSLGYFINYFATGYLVHSTEAVIDSEIRYVEAVGIETAIANQKKEELYVALNKDGSLPHHIPPVISRLTEGIIVFEYPDTLQRYAAKIETLSNNQKILVGTNITAISDDFRFMQGLGVASIVFVVVVVFVSYVISVFVVSGTNKVAQTAYEIIQTGDLSRRVDVGFHWDDLGNMAMVLNMLLDRIETLMQGVQAVSDNIAHDLRTPLTRMRGHIDNLSDGMGKEKLLEEVDHILDTFNALLRIAHIETAKQRNQFDRVALSPLLDDVVSLYEPLAEERNITLNVEKEKGIIINGDKDLLFQAYANLLDNAIKFTKEKGRVDIKLYEKEACVYVEILDTGIGVDKKDEKRIFDRFYRSDKSRGSSGTGLGLSLVTAVINLHDGDIEVVHRNPGLGIITKI